MCIVLYVGSDHDLPFRNWIPPDAEIGICEAVREPDVAAISSEPFVYSIGTEKSVAKRKKRKSRAPHKPRGSQ